MDFADILRLAWRNLRESKLRSTLTTLGIVIGVAVIVTLVSFGLGLQRNTIDRFRALDLFTEITVFGRSLERLATAQINGETPDASPADNANSNNSNTKTQETPRGDTPGGRRLPLDQDPQVLLDDTILAAIQKLPGVVAVEPNISFSVYLRARDQVRQRTVAGVLVPNPASRFKNFAAGRMMETPDAGEIVLDDRTARDFGFTDAQSAIGQKVDFLAPPDEEKPTAPKKAQSDEEADAPGGFFGIPFDDAEETAAAGSLVAQTFTIVGVLAKPENDAMRIRGLNTSGVFISTAAAQAWRAQHRDEMSRIALQLARQSGALKEGQGDGYLSATVRVTDPVTLSNVRNELKKMGLGSFSLVDQIDEIRNVFLIMNAVLGLLGGISLLVASFGIANTMIMSILERTREIGIMKAIGAEDREIKLIFFVEAAVLGLIGGIIGCLVAWGVDALANRLTYRFLLQPQGASFIDFFALPPWLWLGAIFFAVTIAVIAALYPAARAARIDPVQALRHN